MNERIKELMKQADYPAPEIASRAQKLAELIVKECALLCVSRPGPGDDIRSREHCSEQIKEHFGVEE